MNNRLAAYTVAGESVMVLSSTIHHMYSPFVTDTDASVNSMPVSSTNGPNDNWVCLGEENSDVIFEKTRCTSIPDVSGSMGSGSLSRVDMMCDLLVGIDSEKGGVTKGAISGGIVRSSYLIGNCTVYTTGDMSVSGPADIRIAGYQNGREAIDSSHVNIPMQRPQPAAWEIANFRSAEGQ